MCGIVGYIGQEDTKEILLKGLEKLEYRGYDSAGIALYETTTDEVKIFKEKGRIADLRQVVDQNVLGTMGIGHTRWATHGKPGYKNSHPHQSEDGRFTLVHNGVIENYEQLRDSYLEGVTLISDTDTEIIVQLIAKFAQEGLNTEEALRKTLKLIEGSYALAIIDITHPNTMYVAKNKSPLLVGLGEGFNVVASDAMAMLQVTDIFVELADKEIVMVKRESVKIKNLEGEVVSRESFKAELDASDIEKGTYEHYMLKEINEQPSVIRKIIQAYQNEQGNLTVEEDLLKVFSQCQRIYIVACGTSYHAGLIGKDLIEKWAKIPTEVHIASEFAYNLPLLSEGAGFIFISQSGETADSRAVLKLIRENYDYPTLTITNVPGSTLSREANYTLALYAGPEIAVASTKAYTAQVAVLSIFANVLAVARQQTINIDLIKELGIVANAMGTVIDAHEKLEKLTSKFLDRARNCFYIGRALDYYVCLEAALKLKEISYIQAEGFAGGELKHGTIALIEEGTPVVALVTNKQLNLNIRGNVKEVAARGAHTCIISMEGLDASEDSFVIPNVNQELAPLVSVVAVQLMAYYAALHRDCDVDKPRNLAKSVTVE